MGVFESLERGFGGEENTPAGTKNGDTCLSIKDGQRVNYKSKSEQRW